MVWYSSFPENGWDKVELIPFTTPVWKPSSCLAVRQAAGECIFKPTRESMEVHLLPI
ncbi:MAG: hypothetical protein PHS30_02760 [Bacteroidales bacterium]|nr:hypothetical protein [Bacteroidales bacterium]